MKEFNLNSIAITVTIFLFFFFSCNLNIERKNPDTVKKQQPIFEKKNNPDTILLVSMAFDEENLLAPITKKVSSFYGIPIKYIKAPLPAFAYLKARNRYKADSLLKYLTVLNNGHFRFVAGITSADISTKNGKIHDWGVFGLANLSAEGCVTSSFRLKRKASSVLLTERIQKVILHEIGHNYGLDHCKSPFPCFMKAAEGKISQVDSEPMDICKVCRQKKQL